VTRPVRLVVFLEFDQELLAPRFRAEEQAVYLLARAARLVGERRGGAHLLVQTRVPGHEVFRAIREARPGLLAAAELARRAATGFPPFGGLAELSGDADAVDEAVAALRAGPGQDVTVLGPVNGSALVRSPDGARLADALDRAIGPEVRAHGRLRVAVDPPRV
jgi:primosomal protein N' (replication factor Y)